MKNRLQKIFSNYKKLLINANPRKKKIFFFNSKIKTNGKIRDYGTYSSISSFNLVIFLKNSEVPSLKTTFNGQIIPADTKLIS